jgi:hypothetical protein
MLPGRRVQACCPRIDEAFTARGTSMDFSSFGGIVEWLGLTKAAALAAAVSVLAAAASLVGGYLSARLIEATKARHLKDLEERKIELQTDLEARKSALQVGLEGRKTELQKDLEERKTDLQMGLEARKSTLQKDLEQFKGEIAEDLAAQNARRAYEYEARKRLYMQVEPLLFQLFEAAEGAFHAVTSLVRTQRRGEIPAWLSADGYYLRSIIHRLYSPLVILRLIQRSTTLLDLTLDPSIRLRYALLKEGYLTHTDDFGLARVDPVLRYDPNAADWQTRREADPGVYWRQGLMIGRLDRLLDAMVTAEGTSRRPMDFGEFESAIHENVKFKAVYQAAQDVFIGFDFQRRPVLGRLLLSYALLMHTLMSVYGQEPKNTDLPKMISDFLNSDDSQALRWSGTGDPDVLANVQAYVLGRIKQATTQGGYVKF